ncbi:N-acetylglucosamine kinase [Compostibacter hankyongensis]|uniref:ATPase n=1 Tax=Compostibacter hankyongensis TaxID=1007089 RepID=A0ABP8FH89_9BACT
MMTPQPQILIADSGSTKTTWCLLSGNRKKMVRTQGISPYFQTGTQMEDIFNKELLPGLGRAAARVERVCYYGTGCADPKNAAVVKRALRKVFAGAKLQVTHDLMGAARALCGRSAGIACILGTGSSICYFNGRTIPESDPGLGYILGDEGSGAYLGRKVLQHYLYHFFDPELTARFEEKYDTDRSEILDKIYKEPLANRYLASCSLFLQENRGHKAVESILEEGLDDFFFRHIYRYAGRRKAPVHFVGGIAHGYRDVVRMLCKAYELTCGNILKAPMDGLVAYHKKEAAG